MGIDVKKGDLAKHNAVTYKEYVIRILIVAAICILSAFAVELFCNIKLLRLPADIKGIHDTEFTEKVFDVAAIVEGDPENLKITTPVDLVIAEAILAEREGR